MSGPALSATRNDQAPSGGGVSTGAVRPRAVIVTGLSGAGRTTALRALEDLGYEAVDNPPLALLAGLLPTTDLAPRPMAIGIDVRTRDFVAPTALSLLDRIIAESGRSTTLLFLDCDDEALGRRYTETRRRHPLAIDRPVLDGIRQEREILAPLRARADLVLDTTALPPAELKRVLEGSFALDAAPGLAVSVLSFSYRRGLPREADLVIDVRFLDNPHYDPALRPLTGRDAAVGARIAADPDFVAFFDGLTAWLAPLLPRYAKEGKSYLTIAVGCTGGKHRSVYVAERLGGWFAAAGRRARVHHRDVDTAP
ncbi:MAG: RNase adapter RapZ [Alphaproteobacteria bacterium]|nr:RNase adapter RapZ [Alphaproteobacteria bacterium]